jgi:hypothetical protein
MRRTGGMGHARAALTPRRRYGGLMRRGGAGGAGLGSRRHDQDLVGGAIGRDIVGAGVAYWSQRREQTVAPQTAASPMINARRGHNPGTVGSGTAGVEPRRQQHRWPRFQSPRGRQYLRRNPRRRHRNNPPAPEPTPTPALPAAVHNCATADSIDGGATFIPLTGTDAGWGYGWKQTGGRSRKRLVVSVITKGLWTAFSGEGPAPQFATSSVTSRPPRPVTSRRTRPLAWSRPAEAASPCAARRLVERPVGSLLSANPG